jgi:hypothetical protein
MSFLPRLTPAAGMVGLALACAPCPATPAALALPRLDATDLNGKPVRLPMDLTGDRTVLLIAFEREQQADIDGWVEGLGLKASGTAWLELPVIENPGTIGRFLIDAGMRRGLPDSGVRARVVTLYTDKQAIKSALGIQSETVHALVVDRAGRVLASAEGRFDPRKASRIRELAR